MVKVEFEFALRVVDRNECRLKKKIFLKIFEKISYIWNYIDPR